MSLFPIDHAESYLRKVATLERDGNVLRWPSHDGVTELRVREIHDATRDGLLVSEYVTLEHTSKALDDLRPEAIPFFNRLAAVSALVPRDGDRPTRLVSKVGVFSGDHEAAARLYAPILCMEAASSIGWYATLIGRQVEANPHLSPYDQTDEDPPYDDSAYKAVEELAFSRGYVASVGERSLAVEFPWDPGAVSNLFAMEGMREMARDSEAFVTRSDEEIARMGGRTSLLQLMKLDHPFYGKGVQSRLEIPVFLDDASAVALANDLNRWELSGHDLPPLFGAWCVGDRSMTFVSFFPTQLCLPGLLQNLTVWAAGRHQRVREWLDAPDPVQ